MLPPDRTRARELAAESRLSGDATSWFDQLYKEQEQGQRVVPWADLGTNPNLLEFLERNPVSATCKTALVIGCGFGDDAEHLAACGFETTAFDVSPTAIRAAKQRFLGTRVNYAAADLLVPPIEWTGAFDFVLESYTLQVLPPQVRARAMPNITGFVKKDGMILLIARGRDENDGEGQMPWPLMRRELDLFTKSGLREESFEDYLDQESPPVRRFRAVYVK